MATKYEKYAANSANKEKLNRVNTLLDDGEEKALLQAKELLDGMPTGQESEKLREKCDQKLDAVRQIARRKFEKEQKIKKRLIKVIATAMSIVAIVGLGVVIYENIVQPFSKYNNAMKLASGGHYKDAIIIFEELGDYKDSLEQIEVCKETIKKQNYDKAVALFNKGDYEGAISEFSALGDYRDSVEQIEKCNDAIKKLNYDNAMALYNIGEYNNAVLAFEALGDYNDSPKQLINCYVELCGGEENYNIFKNIVEGTTISFGTYKQDDDSEVDPIEWTVIDKKNTELLLISTYGLDIMQYSGTHWMDSKVRRVLNGSFLENSFSEEQRNCIIQTSVTADLNTDYSSDQGKTTEDFIFLLSIDEAQKYFSNDSERCCKITKYVYELEKNRAVGEWNAELEENKPYIEEALKKIESLGGNCTWWLRTNGKSDGYAAVVTSKGKIDTEGYSSGTMQGTTSIAIRPTMKIDVIKYIKYCRGN